MKKDFIERLYGSLATPLINSFRGTNILFHSIAIAGTYYIADSGLDWEFYGLSGVNEYLLHGAYGAVLAGMFLPLLLPVVLYLWGVVKPNLTAKRLGLVLMQAAVLALMVSSGYKAVTGRMPPEYRVSFLQPSAHDMPSDISNVWSFGFMERGVFDGWPSGHTTVAFAMSIAFLYALPRNKKWQLFFVVYAVYIGLGVGITIHWISDAFAGALIGIAVGRAVGKHNK